MRFKKSMILLILLAFLISMSYACAIDANDTQASSDEQSPIELTQNEEIDSTDEAHTIGQTEKSETLSANPSTYSGLGGENHTLTVTTIPYENRHSTTRTADITVSKAQAEIILNNKTINLNAVEPIKLENLAELIPAGIGNLTFTSSDDNIVTIKDGYMFGCDKGNATVIVSFAGNEHYASAESEMKVIVKLESASISVKNSTLDLKIDDTCRINATTDPEWLNIEYESSDESVATVDENGIITAIGEGTTIITLSVGNGADYTLNSTNVTVTVSKIPTEIILANATMDLKVLNFTFTGARLNPSKAGNLNYISSNSTVAAIENGVIIPLAAGNATITVSFRGNDKYAAAENRTIFVSVSLNDASVTVDNATLDLKIGDAYAIKATTIPEKTKLPDIVYTSSNESVAIVDENGIVTAISKGNAIIIVTVGDDEVFAKNSTEILIRVNNIPTEFRADDVATVYNVNRYLTITLKDINGNPIGNATVTVDLNGAKNYTTDENGEVRVATDTLSAGTYTAKITFEGNEDYARTNASAHVTVAKDTSILTAINVETTYSISKNLVITLTDSRGNALKGFDMTVDLNGVKTYATNNNGQVTINIAKLVPNTYTARITFKESANYLESEKTVKVTVIKATSKLTAKKKTFKKSEKVKKYTITLKSGKTPIKKAKVTIKLGKKTFKATTNAKGKATFKIKKMTQKKKYNAVIKYKGDKYYTAVTQKVKIKIK